MNAGFVAASKSASGDGHTSTSAHQIFIFARGVWDVCERGHWQDVMNPWIVLRCRSDLRDVRPNRGDVGCPACPFSKSARSGAPSVISVNVKKKARVILPHESHPPADERRGACGWIGGQCSIRPC